MSELDRMSAIAERMAALSRTFDTLQQAWPTGREFSGGDSTGALRVVITSKGEVVGVTLASDWSDRLEPRELARALNEAVGAASAKIAESWFDDLENAPSDPAPAPAPRRHRSLAEYRAENPRPRDLAELQPSLDALEAARLDYARHKERMRLLTHRDRFESPRRLFTVTRTRGNLVALDVERDALALVPNSDIERELVATMTEIRKRDAADQERLDEEFPAIIALRDERRSG